MQAHKREGLPRRSAKREGGLGQILGGPVVLFKATAAVEEAEKSAFVKLL
jgi:hypothetical protein